MNISTINSVSEIQNEIKRVLDENVYFSEHRVPILCENAKDIDYQIKSAISQIGSLVTITTPTLTFQGKLGDGRGEPFWMIRGATVVVAETPTLNRSRADCSTAMDTALQVAETLNERLDFIPTSINQTTEAGIIVVTVQFTTEAAFTYEKQQK